MKRFAVAVLLLAVAFYAWPMWSAFQLRQALRAADAAALEPRVDWPLLRANLRTRVAANLRPAPNAGWFRRQAARVLVPIAAGRTIDAVVTPERLAWFLARRMQVSAPQPAPPPAPPLAPSRDAPQPAPGTTGSEDAEEPTPDPMAPRRLRYAFFDSLSTFRIEVADKTKASRRLVAILERRGLGWKLVDVYYVTQP